jgi:hypothetical protein
MAAAFSWKDGGMKQEPLLSVGKAWFSNTAAEACARLPWLLVAALALASSLAIALPFGAGRWREAREFADPAAYPGLGSAFLALSRADLDWKVSGGALAAPGAEPVVIEASGWTVLVGSGIEGAPTVATLSLGPDALSIYHPRNDWLLRSVWGAFEGFDSATLREAASDRARLGALVEGLLWTAAFARLPSDLTVMALLLAVQYLFFTGVLALFLSLASFRAGSGGDGRRPKPEPLKAFKVVVAVVSGPAFLVGLAGLLVPALSASMLWLGFSLLAGVRVVIVYADRYRSAAQADRPSA